jgi:lipopolysaccharide transport system permease protein
MHARSATGLPSQGANGISFAETDAAALSRGTSTRRPRPRTVTPPLYTIRPFSSRILPDFGELWRYRELVWTFAARDLQLRYRQTLLGVMWVVLQPIIAAGVFTFVFGKVARLASGGLPYFFIAFTGYTAYQLFSSTVSKAGSSLTSNAHVLTKVYIPRLVLPLSGILSTLVDLALALVIYVVAAVLYRVPVGPAVLLLPLWFAFLLALGLGIGLVVAAWTLRFRDVQHVLPIVLQLLLYATPVAYLTSVVPERAQRIVAMNPLTPALDGVRWSLLGQPAPSAVALGWLVFAALLSLLVGLVVFNRYEQELADVI